MPARHVDPAPAEHVDPALAELAEAVLNLDTGSVAMLLPDGSRRQMTPHPGLPPALMGLRCPPASQAVATSFDGTVHGARRPAESGRVALAVDLRGDAVLRCRFGGSGRSRVLRPEAGPLLDMAMRALGLRTAPSTDPVVWLADGVFLQRLTWALSARAQRPQPCAPPLTWEEIAAAHPLAAGRGAVTPRQLRELRDSFERRWSWRELHELAVRRPRGAPQPLPGLGPEMAAWLDEGSFARLVLSRFGDVANSHAHVAGLLEPMLAGQLNDALGFEERPGAPRRPPNGCQNG